MKKLISLTLAMLVLFTGCAKGEETQTTLETQTSDLSSRNLTHIRGASNTTYNENGVYETIFIDDFSLIYYTDFESKISMPLCANPECTHSNESCTAYLADSVPFLFMNANGDKLFANIQEINEDGFGVQKIYKMELDGSSRELIYECKANEEIDITRNFMGSDNKIYLLTKTYVQEGEQVFPISKIIEINYETKEVKIILETEHEIYLKDIIGENLIYQVNTYETNVTQNNTISISNGEITTISETMVAFANVGEYFGNFSQFYQGIEYNVSNKNGSEDWVLKISNLMSKEKNELLLSQSEYPPSIVDVFDENIILFYTDYINGNVMKVLNTKTGESKDLTLKVDGDDRGYEIAVSAVNDDEFFVINRVETIEYIYKGKQGEDIPGQISVYRGAFILKDDYYNSTPNYIPVEYLD